MNPTEQPNGKLFDSFLPPKPPVFHSSGAAPPGTPVPQEESLQDSGYLRHFLLLTLTAAIYFGAAKLGLSLAFINANVSPVWPPTGIAIAAVLLLGYRIWPGILLGAFLANFLTPVPVASAMGIAVGNTMEALSAGLLLRSMGFRNSFDRAKDVSTFVLGVLLSTMVSATVGNLSLRLGQASSWENFGSLWLTWWLGDSIGGLVVAPLLLTWGSKGREWLPTKRYLEAALLLSLLSVASMMTFGVRFPIPVELYPVVRLTVPFFIWAAFRLGRRGVTLATAVLSVIAIWGTAHGLGPFAGRTINESLLQLQVFVGSNAIIFMFLVAVVEERRRSEETLRESERRLAGNLAITRILAESPALSDATPRILQTIGETLGWEMGDLWMPDGDRRMLACQRVWSASSAKVDKFEAASCEYTFAPGIGLPGRVWASLKPAWIPDVAKDDNFPRAPVAVAEGLHGAFAFPILSGQKFLAVMEFFSHEIREPDASLLEMFGSIGSQIGQFMERKSAEELLLKNRETLKLANKISRGGTWQYDLVTNTVAWSEEYYELLGLAPGKVPASFEEWFRRVHLDDLSAVLKEHENAIAEKRDVNIEFRIRRADQQWRWFKQTGRCVYGADGRPLSMIGITFDITERKQAEEALRQSEEQLRLALEAANMGAWEYEIRSEAVKWSSNLEAIHGLAPGSFGGTFDDFRNEIHAEDRQNVLESLARSIEDGAQHEIEYRIIRPDGAIRWLEGKGQVIRDGTGKAVRMTGLCVDITERKCAEEEREQLLRSERAARAEAEAANRTKDEFLALLSHELRTPLVAILGWATTLSATPQPDEALTTRALETIKRNARLQTRIIEDMLDVSRIVTGKLQLDIRPVDLASIIEAAIATVQPTADTKGVRFQLMLDSAVGPVSGDPHRLQQVVWNLLSNAIKFTPGGGLVEIKLKESRCKAEITVSDTGEGIPAEFLPHIFDRFRQADSSTTRKHGGLGLGLAIVRHLVELQGGAVAAHSAGEDRGSIFTITLPCVTAHPVAPLAQHHLEDGRRRESTMALTGLRILYVEDDTDSREALAAVLLLYGAAVKSVATVPEALEVLSRWQPDVLVSNIGLPHEDGYDLIRQIRAREPADGGTVPAIALTGYAGVHENERAVSAGYQMYLAKPVEPGRLAEIITTLVGKDGKPYRDRASASPTRS